MFGYHRMPSTTTPTAPRFCTGGTTRSATARCRTHNAHRAAAPHRRCRLFGYHQMPDTATPFAPRPGYRRCRLLATARRRAAQRHFGCGRPQKITISPLRIWIRSFADVITDHTNSQDVSALPIMQGLTRISTEVRSRRQTWMTRLQAGKIRPRMYLFTHTNG